MIIKDLLELFEMRSEKENWGDYPAIVLFSDGSGEIINDDDETIFSFENIEELEKELKD